MQPTDVCCCSSVQKGIYFIFFIIIPKCSIQYISLTLLLSCYDKITFHQEIEEESRQEERLHYWLNYHQQQEIIFELSYTDI